MAASQFAAPGEEIHNYLDSRNLWLMVAAFTFFNLFVRWYEEVYGWSAGLDAFAPEFKTYWMNWLYIESVTWIVLFCYIGASLWKTRTRDMDALTPREVLERHFHHLVWLVAYGIAIYWGASFYTEQDGTWHQTVIRDTDFTPSHIIGVAGDEATGEREGGIRERGSARVDHAAAEAGRIARDGAIRERGSSRVVHAGRLRQPNCPRRWYS